MGNKKRTTIRRTGIQRRKTAKTSMRRKRRTTRTSKWITTRRKIKITITRTNGGKKRKTR